VIARSIPGGNLSRNKDPSVQHLDSPARQVVERWRPGCSTGSQVEAGVVPGPSYGISHREPLGERGTVVGTAGRSSSFSLPQSLGS
jgi:hypothetical protein